MHIEHCTAGDPRQQLDEHFRAFADAAPVLMWMSDADKQGIFFNHSWLAFTGRPVEEQFGDGWLASVHPDDRQPLFDLCLEAFRDRRPFTAEFRLRRADGQYRWFLDSGAPRFDPDGSFAGFIGTCVDITDRKQAEQALRDSEQRLRLALEAGRMGTWEWNICENEVIWSRGLEAIHGLAPGAFAGTFDAYQQDIHRDDRQRVQQAIAHTLATGDEHHVEYRIVWPDGSVHWVEGRGKLFRDAAGAPVRMIGVCTEISERKQVEQALCESEERFARFMQHLPGLAWIKDMQGRYVYANDAAVAAFQVSRAGLYGRTDNEVFPPETAASFQENDRRALSSEAGVQVVETLEHADGVLHYSLVSKFPIPDAHRRASLVGGMAIDITEYRQAEIDLRRSESRKAAMLHTALDAIVTIDHEGTIVEFNRAAERTFGWRRDEVLGRNMAELVIPPSLRERHRHGLARYLATGESEILDRRIELPALRADGSEFIAELAITRIPTEYPPLFTAFLRDVTERKRAEQALAAKERELQLVAETTPLILTRCSRDLKYRFVNRAAAALFGARREDVIGRPIVDIMGRTAFDQIKPYVEQALSGVPVEFEAEIGYPAAGRRWVRVTYTPERDERDEVVGWVASIVDITELKRAEEALRDAHRRKDEFLAMLAHELRNPLAPIRSGLDLLALESDRDRETVAMMQDQVHHLVRLVDDLLDVSRVMRGKIELRMESVELVDLVRRSVVAVRTFVDSRRQQLTLSLPEQPLWLHADPVRLVQIVQNLLHNAAKYTEAEGHIELGVAAESGFGVIRVRDTGIGIEAELLPKIFDLFTQSSRTLDRSQGGLGIGLTLVRRLVDLHGGSIEVISEGPGLGSEFVVRLPLVEELQGRKESTPAASSLSRQRILVVDDNSPAARVLEALLAKLGKHEISIAGDGPTALAAIERQRPDLVLLDIGLPGMDGYEVARRVRALRQYDDICLVAVTGYGQEEDRRRSQDAGIDLHLTKPIGIRELQELLSRHRRRQLVRHEF